MSLFKIVLGDPSNDGHGQHEDILIDANASVGEMQKAYKDSCRRIGVSFNHNEDFTETDRNCEEKDKYYVCTEYEECKLTPEVIEVFKKYKCPYVELKSFIEDPYVDQDIFVDLLMWFIGLSMPETFLWKRTKEDIPCLNQSGKLKVHFGYGLFEGG